jgi:tetratricopeptide (TPR) repeat protein
MADWTFTSIPIETMPDDELAPQADDLPELQPGSPQDTASTDSSGRSIGGMVDDWDGAIDLARELEFEFDASPKALVREVDKATTPFELARAYFEMSLFEEALEELEKARREESLSVEAQTLVARCRLARAELPEAIRQLQSILNRTDLSEKQELEVLYELGQAYEVAEQFKPALEIYEEILGLNDAFRPNDVRQRRRSCLQRLENAGRTVTTDPS